MFDSPAGRALLATIRARRAAPKPYGTNFAEAPGLRDMIETALEERLARRRVNGRTQFRIVRW